MPKYKILALVKVPVEITYNAVDMESALALSKKCTLEVRVNPSAKPTPDNWTQVAMSELQLVECKEL